LNDLAAFNDMDYYRAHFFDLAVWEAHARAVCARHGLECVRVSTGTAGSYPTCLVDERYVVKFFGRLLEGGEDYRIELSAHTLLTGNPQVPAPRLLASGHLLTDSSGWDWPYIVVEFIHGQSIGEQFDRLSDGQKKQAAGDLGSMIAGLHSLPVPTGGPFDAGLEGYTAFIAAQRAGQIATPNPALPAHLAAGLGDYLLEPHELLEDDRPPHLIHADLTGDHLMGVVENGAWHTTGLIDFGDAMVGTLYYELAAVMTIMFPGDRAALGGFLTRYRPSSGQMTDFPRRCLCTALLHRFDAMGPLFEAHPHLAACSTLDELARAVWLPAGFTL